MPNGSAYVALSRKRQLTDPKQYKPIEHFAHSILSQAMSAKKPGYSPRTSQGINFFSHFPRQRLRPYGEIKEATPDSVMLEKASRLNCEYVIRPAVALSEMADTVTSNLPTLKDMLRNMDEAKVIREVEEMNEAVKMFNTRSDLPVRNSDVHNLLKYTIADDDDGDSDATFDQIEHLGMLMYVIASHQKQLKNTTVMTQSKTTVITPMARRNLFADLGSDSESDSAPKRSKKKKRNQRKNPMSPQCHIRKRAESEKLLSLSYLTMN